jgi:hypothetical protein
MKKENKVRCVDCLKFKTRVIPDFKALSKDEFRKRIPVQRQLKKHPEGLRVYYCILHRRPLLESHTVHKRVVKNCEHVEAI